MSGTFPLKIFVLGCQVLSHSSYFDIGSGSELTFKLILLKVWNSIHSVSFISNVYKQRFFQPVDFSVKNKQQTSWCQNIKQRHHDP